MHLDGLDGFHEIVFDANNPHVIVHYNTQTRDFPTHWHTPLEILMPVKNNYTAFVNNKEYNLHPDDILFVNPNVYHSYITPATGSRYFILIDVSVLKDILGFNQILYHMNPATLITSSNAPKIHSQVKALLLEICDACLNPKTINYPAAISKKQEKSAGAIHLSESIVYSKLLEIILLIAENLNSTDNSPPFTQNKQQEIINRFTMICNYIDTHCTEELTLENTADLANFSKYHFSRVFKEFTGESFYKYVNRKRIKYSKQLLTHQKSMSITDIALASGFSSTSAFTRMFKLFTNCTPKEFRENQRNTELN